MKVQCDVCNKEAASVFCCADEAALCHGCDQSVHHANKVAGKHHRLPLHHSSSSSSKQSPLCDICKERRAFLFCQEDRAILCRDCDIPIHSANDLTAKHNRFLLTGIKLLASSSSSEVKSPLKSVSGVPPAKSPPPAAVPDNSSSEDGSVSSISDYLINTLLGWHVEDLLDNSIDFLF